MSIMEQMNLELALEIFLEKPGKTWRSLSSSLSTRYPDQGFDDQLCQVLTLGMYLETDAVKFLQEYLKTCSEADRALLLTHPSSAVRKLAEMSPNQLDNIPFYIDEIMTLCAEA
jgi:hypothetical protein